MADYISHLDVSIDATEEQYLQARGFKKINVDLNKGAGGKYIYIWYKKEAGPAPITRVQFTFNDDMAVGLIKAGYTKIPKDLNAGAVGDYIYLWYFSGSTEYDIPIVDIDVTAAAESEAIKFGLGWERLACDLNRMNAGHWTHAWVRRGEQTYICDVTATDSYESDANYFKRGYIRLDEDTNRGAQGAFVFIWYRQTTDFQRALSALQISTYCCQHQGLKHDKYQRVNVNLNEGTLGDPVYLWYKKEETGNPIRAITLLVSRNKAQAYKEAGLNVIERHLNKGNTGRTVYLCVQ